MRARQGLANTLWELEREEETLTHYRDLLHLNPNDNQGIRYSLLNLLMRLNRDAKAQELLQEYPDDAAAEWLYTRALLAFRVGGASPAAERALQEALELNTHVPAYLTGRKRIPNRLPASIVWGGESEAAAYASGYLPLWRQTSGAVDWLRQSTTSSGAESHRKPSVGTKRKGAKKRQRRRRQKR
jgi:tetratricopeptide (TPR) repeat protein